MLLPGRDEDLVNLNVIHELILPHHEASEANAEEYRDERPKKMQPGTCLDLTTGGEGNS